MDFYCENPHARYSQNRAWTGRVSHLECHGSTVEMDVCGKGSAMHVIIGRYEHGTFLCIPDWGIGSPLASLRDTFWNTEALERRMSRPDAITVSAALDAIADDLQLP